MEISGVGPGTGPQEYQRHNAEKAQNASDRQDRDTVQISEEARRLLQEKELQSAANTPDAEKRVEALQVLLADKLVSSGTVRDPDEAHALAGRVARNIVSADKGVDDRLEAIANRIQSGYYDRPEVANRIAERLLKEMGL